MEAEKGNKLIAEFLGYKYHRKVIVTNSDGSGSDDFMDIWSKDEILVNDYGDQVYFSDDWYKSKAYTESIYGELKYHKSWDCLMPVIEKIENITDKSSYYLFSFEIGRDWCCIGSNDFNRKTIIAKSEYNNKIASVWQATVQFIKWYNQTQSPLNQ